MSQLFEAVSPTSLLIVCAVGTYVLGFLFRDQLYIRLLVVIGSSLYACYYWVQGPEPLWDAILGSALIAMASAQGLLRILWSRHASSVPRGNRHIFRLLSGLEPGLFNRLMSIGERLEVQTPTILTREGALPEALWFMVGGAFSLERKGHAPVLVEQSGFIGELAWMLKENASATVIAQPGSELIRWHHADLKRAMQRNHRLELALDAVIATDIARKLAKSRPIDVAVGSTHEQLSTGENRSPN